MGASDIITTQLALVPNEEMYWGFIRELRSDPAIQKGFVEQGGITAAQQRVYMEMYNYHYLVCLLDGIAVGYIGEINNDIRLAVHPFQQRKGIGEWMVKEFMVMRPDSRPKVLKTNWISQRLFVKCGFVFVRQDELFYYYDN